MKLFVSILRQIVHGAPWLVLLTAVPFVFAAQTPQPDFGKYDVILTRQPFGVLSSSAENASLENQSITKPPEESFIRDYRMCAIRESKAGISVGLVNIKSEPVRTFFLFIGESEEGIELLAADYNKENALLRKDGDEQWVSMSSTAGVMAESIPPESGGGNLTGVQNLITARLQQTTRNVNKAPFTGLSKEAYKEKLASGEVPPPLPARYALRGRPEDSGLTSEEREARLRKYNMDLIRAGGAQGIPLPIPLTPDEDAQLVQEGFLPPQ